MVGTRMGDNELDSAIDEAAREMTAGAPRGDFNARLLARVDRDRRPAVMWRPAVAGLAAVAAMLLVVFIAFRPHGAAPDRESSRATARSNEPAPRPKTIAGAQQQTAKVEFEPNAASTAAVTRRTGVGRAVGPSAIDALAPARLDVASIEVAVLGPTESIAVDPLEAVASITVTPLAIDREGDRP
jgi:hypothetical protein